MAKINLQKLQVPTDISGKTKGNADLRESIANHLYNGRSGIAALDLAMKIYKSEGETEYSDKEVAMIRDIIENTDYTCAVLHAFNEALATQEPKEE